jgi:hypothetical protein
MDFFFTSLWSVDLGLDFISVLPAVPLEIRETTRPATYSCRS